MNFHLLTTVALLPHAEAIKVVENVIMDYLFFLRALILCSGGLDYVQRITGVEGIISETSLEDFNNFI